MKSAGLVLPCLIAATAMSATSQLIFVGTYTPKDGASRGIYAVRLDDTTGALSEPELAAATPNPTFLVRHPNRRVLYAISESGTVAGRPGGAVSAFALDPVTSRLALLNTQPTGGGGLTHLDLDHPARMLVAVSYSAGQVAAFPVAPDGRLGPRTSWLTTTGPLGPNASRQERSHPHSVIFSPDDRFAYVCDLGLDRIFRYQADPAAATLTPAGDFAAAPGAGPRHSRIPTDGRYLYVINELNATIAVYARDAVTGALAPRQVVATLPQEYAGTNTTAEIHLHPTGRFVYGSNRGHDSLAVFARNADDGTLQLIQIVPSGGGHPRNFSLSSDGRWLVCANRDSNNLVAFKVDPATGRLTPAGHTATVPQAVCVLFAD